MPVIEPTKARRSRLPLGLRAVFFKISERYHELLRELESEVQALKETDSKEQQSLIDRHLAERWALEREVRLRGAADDFHATLKPAFGQDTRQRLIAPPDDLPLTRAQFLQDPELFLDHISQTRASFERADILRALARRIDDPFELKEATDRGLQSPELVKLDGEPSPTFTTKDFRESEDKFHALTKAMVSTGDYSVADGHTSQAIRSQNRKMRSSFGEELSEEQKAALKHVLAGSQLASMVGLAGAGESTLLATANEAWCMQWVTVHGVVLAGKVADGMETASGIRIRTLASLETAWTNGCEPIGRGDVLVVNEAGMIGTRQLAKITSKMQEIGAKLVLVGDPDQLQPIEAGRPFRDLVEDHGAAVLAKIHRQRLDRQSRLPRSGGGASL